MPGCAMSQVAILVLEEPSFPALAITITGIFYYSPLMHNELSENRPLQLIEIKLDINMVNHFKFSISQVSKEGCFQAVRTVHNT